MIKTLSVNIWTKEELKWQWDLFVEGIKTRILRIEARIFSQTNKQFWLLAYETTHRCGSRLDGHYPIFNNSKNWLWSIKDKGDTKKCKCSICGSKVIVKIGFSDLSYQYFKKGREDDVKELNRLYSRATNETERSAIKKSLTKINNETMKPGLKSAREALVRATRAGNVGEIKNIHESIQGKDRFSNE